MKVRVIRFYLIIQHSFASLEQLLLWARLISDNEVDMLIQIFWLFEVDDFVLSFESFFKKIEGLLNGLVDELAAELWVTGFQHRNI